MKNDTVGLSIEDRKFIALMGIKLQKDEKNAHHYHFVIRRNSYQITEMWWFNALNPKSPKRDPAKREHFFAFMYELLNNNHGSD